MNSIKSIVMNFSLCLALFATQAQADSVGDAKDLFKGYLTNYSVNGAKYDCSYYLNKSWSSFTGDNALYKSLETEYLDGATFAGLCAVEHGIIVSQLLEMLEPYVADGTVKKIGLNSTLKLLYKARDDSDKAQKSMTKLNNSTRCVASTPHIHTEGNIFNQSVNMECTSSLMKVVFDLKNNSLMINDSGFWNVNGEYNGRTLEQVLKTEVSTSNNPEVESSNKLNKKKKT